MTLSCIAGHWVQSPPTCSISYPGPFPRVDCSHLNLSAVPQNLPDDVYNLDLSYNNILTITNMSFAAYGKLQVLILRWNALTQIEGNSFEHLLDLRVVYMNFNNISRLPDALFHNNLHLSLLELSHNRLTDIPNNALGSIRALKFIFLGHNLITNISFAQFSSCQHLFKIDLTNNKITHLHQESFAAIWNCTIDHLDLAFNKLQFLRLDSNDIRVLDPLVLHGVRYLKYIDLFGNKIEKLANVISLFEKNLLIYTPNLTRLYLHNNHLTTISANTYFPETLVRLDISHNPFTCDCSLTWFQNWLHTTNVNATPFNETLCSQSSFKELVNLPLEAFHPGDFCGINAPLISGLISGSVIVTLLGLLIYRKRWWLNYKIFLLKLFVLGYKQQEEDVQANDYEYQLNIMCHDYDDDWVHRVLRPALEERMPHLQRVAYGDEALRVSMYYIDAVHHIIETSYKTVLLISNHCVDDAWFITKVRVALEHVNETGLDKVILVFLEDIPDERLPYLVRLFLSRNRPNLVWTEDHDGQDLFWAYFEKSMQTNPHINHVFPI
ncbi:toll-like receptor 4 [Diadema setosum]|uniref:toll-like receptor 4 n=1 Tax=Diadema setosum TaxID=31175 RepID=UPI003B3B464B